MPYPRYDKTSPDSVRLDEVGFADLTKPVSSGAPPWSLPTSISQSAVRRCCRPASRAHDKGALGYFNISRKKCAYHDGCSTTFFYLENPQSGPDSGLRLADAIRSPVKWRKPTSRAVLAKAVVADAFEYKVFHGIIVQAGPLRTIQGVLMSKFFHRTPVQPRTPRRSP